MSQLNLAEPLISSSKVDDDDVETKSKEMEGPPGIPTKRSWFSPSVVEEEEER